MWKLSCAAVLLTASLFSAPPSRTPQTNPMTALRYQVKDFSNLFGMQGFSDDLITMHLKLYENYVKNTNLYLSRIKEFEAQNKILTPDYGALKHRLDWEWNGMRLHEYYFENLRGSGQMAAQDPLYQEIVAQFSSYDQWKQQFIATGMMRGIGWVILYRDPETGKLINTWINEHDVGHLAGGSPLLVMDVFEHAYITEYGLDKGRYIDAFFLNINWDVVSARFTKSRNFQ